MIVEDDSATREVLCLIASSNGFEPTSHGSVTCAMNNLAIVKPTVLLLDWDLGEERSGIDVARVAAGCAWQPSIVMITGSNIDRLRAETRHLPVVAYLQKPFSKSSVDQLLQELQATVEKP